MVLTIAGYVNRNDLPAFGYAFTLRLWRAYQVGTPFVIYILKIGVYFKNWKLFSINGSNKNEFSLLL